VDEHAMKNRSGRANTARVLGLNYPKDGGEPTVLAGSLIDRWRDRPIAEIDSGDVYGVISESVKTGIPGLKTWKKGARDSRGRAVAVALSKLFSWAVAHRLAVANPTQGVFRPRAAAPHHRVLTDAEIQKLWRACDEVGPPFGVVIKLLLLTGQRRSEVAGMRWSEVSDDLAAWSLPPARTKNKLPHQVHLPKLAQEIIAAVPRISGQDFVFSTTGTTAVSGWSKAKKSIDAAVGPVPAWRTHDLRRTAASGMQKLGVRFEVVERALNHVSGSFRGVAGIYQRDPMTEETRTALERWSGHVEGLVSGRPANVVALRGKAEA
jgi:integrase